MKKGFTIIEVSILFVIFLIVPFLLAPLSLDDTRQAKNTSKWRMVQDDFSNIFYSINTQKNDSNLIFSEAFDKAIANDIAGDTEPYKITFLNGTYPNDTYSFNNFKATNSNAILAYKMYATPENNINGVLMYDVNGKTGPNIWGKDIFGYNIYENHFEPFCKSDSITRQKQDCSKNGTGLCCSNYYLIGGDFD